MPQLAPARKQYLCTSLTNSGFSINTVAVQSLLERLQPNASNALDIDPSTTMTVLSFKI